MRAEPFHTDMASSKTIISRDPEIKVRTEQVQYKAAKAPCFEIKSMLPSRIWPASLTTSPRLNFFQPCHNARSQISPPLPSRRQHTSSQSHT